MDGKEMDPVEFHDMLHVPDLRNNLLSPFHLTREKGYDVNIKNSTADFLHGGKLRFSADITPDNIGYLHGRTQIFTPDSAMIAANSITSSTCPMNLSLCHRRCGHLASGTIREMIEKQLVNGVKCTMLSVSDPI
ncbi:hypothetical protein M422DRAFT_145888, partial [Sphaerobolus stellatus SS14]